MKRARGDAGSSGVPSPRWTSTISAAIGLTLIATALAVADRRGRQSRPGVAQERPSAPNAPAPTSRHVAALAVAIWLTFVGGGVAAADSLLDGNERHEVGASLVARPALPAPKAASPLPTSRPPTRLEIPVIGVEAAVDPVTLFADGTIEVPTDVGRVGWWAPGNQPGEPGPAVLVGHIDSTDGPGVFLKLELLRAGDEIRVRRTDGSDVVFVVDRLARHAKVDFPTDEVYKAEGPSSLRLVSCYGRFDRRLGQYDDNLVVFATLRT